MRSDIRILKSAAPSLPRRAEFVPGSGGFAAAHDQLLADFFDTAPLALHWVGPDGVILRVDQFELDLLGYSRDEYVGHDVAEFHADAPVIKDILTRLTCGEALHEYPARLRHKNGSIREVLISSSVLFEDGKFVHTRCFTRDITERKQVQEGLKRAQEQVRESEQRLRFMAESMPQKIFTARPNGDVDYFNPQWSEYTGLTFEQIKDWGWTQFIHPEDVAENVRVWRQSIDTGQPFSFEHRFRRADGEYRWHASRARAMRDAEGRIVMWIGSNTDVHELRDAQDALKRANRYKDEFLAMLAHELRNPLAPVCNALHILRLTNRAEPLHEMMERQVNHIVRLVDDLLEISRISRGAIELKRAPVALAELLRHVVDAGRPLLAESGHQLTVDLTEEPLLLDADPARVTQIFSNLLDNAIKYTPAGGHIWLTAVRRGNQAVVSVRDDGAGISAEMLTRVFELYAQVAASRGAARGGLGIGLSLTRKLVELHGGEIGVRSEGPGKGSEFTVRLPLDGVAKRDTQPEVAALEPVAARRVLVVDDNRDAADSLAMLLKLRGAEVQTAYGGEEALTALEGHRPDAIFLDLGMPEIDGFAVARRVRVLYGASVMLIALTGWGQPQDRERTRAAGFDHHMAKPADIVALQAILTSLGKTVSPSSDRISELGPRGKTTA